MSSRETLLWQQNPIFAAGGPAICALFGARYPALDHQAGTLLLDTGEAPEYLHVLLSGTVRIFHRAPDGREAVVKLMRAPAVFGDIELLCGTRLLESVSAVDEVCVARIPSAEYLEFLQRHPAAVMEHLRHLAAAFCVSACHERQVFFPLEPRVANLLLTYAELYGTPSSEGVLIQHPLSQGDIAQSLGVVRRSVAEVFGRWRKTGLVARYNDRILLKDTLALQRLAGPLRGGLRYEMGLSLAALGRAAASVSTAGATVRVASGPLARRGVVVELGRELLVGRLPPSHLCLPDEEVSPQHCRVFRGATGGRYWVEDLGSLNGSWVNERRIYPRYDFRDWPLEDTGRTIAVPLARRIVYVRVWKLQVGRTRLVFALLPTTSE